MVIFIFLKFKNENNIPIYISPENFKKKMKNYYIKKKKKRKKYTKKIWV